MVYIYQSINNNVCINTTSVYFVLIPFERNFC